MSKWCAILFVIDRRELTNSALSFVTHITVIGMAARTARSNKLHTHEHTKFGTSSTHEPQNIIHV